MLKRVWEVYERDTQNCIIFDDEGAARDQDVFSEVDLIAEANVELSESEIASLKKGHYVCGN